MTARALETRLHPDDRIDPGKTGPQVMRHVTVNAAESPIGWLASRGMLTPAQLGAGERLRGDYERAKQKAARMTNGTVGSNGRKAPIAPSPSEAQPATR